MLSTKPEPGKIDPRVKRTRQSLEQAFVDLLHEKGFQAVTVQDITQRARLNRATFYAHFPDKYALLDYRIRQGFLQEIDKRMLHACHYSLENLRSLIIAVCEFTSKSVSRCKPPHAQYESLVESQVKTVLYELLLNWLRQVGTEVAPETAATAGSWAICGLASQWNHSKQSRSALKFADAVLPLVAANLQVTEPA
jgi:AcrR family transcriptional regulator